LPPGAMVLIERELGSGPCLLKALVLYLTEISTVSSVRMGTPLSVLTAEFKHICPSHP